MSIPGIHAALGRDRLSIPHWRTCTWMPEHGRRRCFRQDTEASLKQLGSVIIMPSLPLDSTTPSESLAKSKGTSGAVLLPQEIRATSSTMTPFQSATTRRCIEKS
ncbi:hypothetical protein CC78DRAFT_582617 [Lojkania enalia]|uniref:Uncharacterized protein n=1 Tax=Lojkania enalia TaxID=147567 RepID=A0A9P4N4S0_9PLEO|nr:hypothetical protein CC78DRAFT_582617 [Didymosphaeria enalia]